MESTVKKKKIGKCIEYRDGNFRVIRRKIDKKGNIASVEVGMYLENNTYNSKGSHLRRLNSMWNKEVTFLRNWGLDFLIFTPIISNTIIDNNQSWCNFIIQFRSNQLNEKLDEGVYEIIQETIEDIITKSKLVVLDK